MLRARFPQTALSVLTLSVLLALGTRVQAQDDPAEPAPKAEKPAPEAPAPKAADQKPARKFRGRLPNYYREVVTEEQREAIYAIQQEYADKIDAIRKQLDALIAERDAKVEGVLTPEQRKQVEKLREQAQAEREKRRAERAAKPAPKPGG